MYIYIYILYIYIYIWILHTSGEESKKVDEIDFLVGHKIIC